MAAPAVVVASNSRLSGTDALRLKNVTFSDDLSHPGVHHTARCVYHGGVRAGVVRVSGCQHLGSRAERPRRTAHGSLSPGPDTETPLCLSPASRVRSPHAQSSRHSANLISVLEHILYALRATNQHLHMGLAASCPVSLPLPLVAVAPAKGP